MTGKYELIICEKPNASKKVAEALADKKAVKKSIGKVSYYELTHNGKAIVVGCAVGHLFNLAEKNKKKGWSYPVFDYEWKPSYEVSKASVFTKPYVAVLKTLSKDASKLIVATDFDIEGSTIGWNVVKFICGKDDGKRMKYSTLTKDELIESYEKASEHLDFPQIESGVTRHSLDWLWGVNFSRALTLSIKNATGMFKILSTGRVQGPSLKLLSDREKEINAFKSEPYWELELIGETKAKELINAWHKNGRFWKKDEAEKIFKNSNVKTAIVVNLDTKETKQAPPFPFDLTSLQIEAYSVLGLSPSRTLEIAQDLYSNGWISYPRTSSQQLPESIGYKKILEKLSKMFAKESKFLLAKKSLKPNNGKKVDAAHPAIYPTGDLPKSLEDKNADLYELIVRRFFSTFGDYATRETLTIDFDANKEIFIAKGTRTKEKGWHELYGKFLKLEDVELPKLNLNDQIKVDEIKMHDKETKPPARYTEASLVKELEKRNLGTKATRSQIIQNLYDRNYVTDKSIKVTDLGMRTVETLEKYCSEILDEKLTTEFENDMESIQDGKKKGEVIIEEAKKFLDKALINFKKHEKEIGNDLSKATIETRDKEAFVGKCPTCKEGDLQMRRGRFGLFAACNRYEQGCKTTFALPKNGKVISAEKECSVCSYPMIKVLKAKRRPQELCINQNCPTKKEEEEKLKKIAADKKCPNCGSGLVVKSGIYGTFLACPGYPKCKYIENLKLEDNSKNELKE
ncbi:MAG TPA: DNA topoisomerase I [Candidatus Nanoarchaeia archaeon]|nr:DNA topoisomerase I [Candidatus Nanoarchaeia archaeon]